MKIKKYTFKMRNDFRAVIICEHCNYEQELKTGYNDNYYHNRVIPNITCKRCGKNRSGIIPNIKNDDGRMSV